MDMLLVDFSLYCVSDVAKSVSSLVNDVAIDSWHVLMSGDRLSGSISTPPYENRYVC
jgi:hypothetical protein